MTKPRSGTLRAAYRGMGEAFERLKVQEKRLLWLIENHAVVDEYCGKYRVVKNNVVLSSKWFDDPLSAIDEVMEP